VEKIFIARCLLTMSVNAHTMSECLCVFVYLNWRLTDICGFPKWQILCFFVCGVNGRIKHSTWLEFQNIYFHSFQWILLWKNLTFFRLNANTKKDSNNKKKYFFIYLYNLKLKLKKEEEKNLKNKHKNSVHILHTKKRVHDYSSTKNVNKLQA
jgi:hypothetical protein